MESFYESLNCRPLGRPSEISQNKTPPREPQFRAPVAGRRVRAPEPEPEPEPEPKPELETREPQQKPNNTVISRPSPPSPPSTASMLAGMWKICVSICVSGPWKIWMAIYVWGPCIIYGGIILSALALVAWFFQKLGPIIFFIVENLSWLLAVISAATTRTFSALPPIPALPTLPALPGFFSSSTPSSAPNTDGPPGIHLLDNSTRVLQVPLELGVVVSGTGVSFEVSTSHTRFLIDTLSDEFGQEKPLLNFEVQKVSDSWNSAQRKWENAKRTWETEMSGFFFNFSWESDQLFALADMWDKADKQQAAARDSLEDSSSIVSSFLLKLRQQLFRGAADGKTRSQSVKASQSVERLRGTVERQVDMSEMFLKDLREIHGYMSESRSVSCGAGNFLLSRQQQQTGETTTGVGAVSDDNVSLSQASDSMYAFCKTMETSIIEIDDLISKVGEDVDMLKKIGWNLSKGFNSLVISMEAKKDSLVMDGDEHAESEKLVRIGVVKIVQETKDELARHFAVQYDL